MTLLFFKEFFIQKKLIIMNKSIEFYFDFSSPYAYLGFKEIIKYEKKHRFQIKYMPIFLGGLHNSADIKPAAFNKIKSKYMVQDTKLVANKKNIKFTFNSYFPIKTVNFMRGAIIAKDNNYEKIYIENIELDVSIPAGTFLLMTDFEIDYLPKGQAKLSVEEIIIPKSLTLHSNYPNPFNSRTSIKIDINKDNAGYIDLDVYDISGRKIDSIYNGIIKKGSHILSWDASNFSAGIYFLKLSAKNSQQTIKLLYVK